MPPHSDPGALTYTYDPAGNRTSVHESSGDRVTWTYDRTDQLLTEHRSGDDRYAVTYGYDPVGHRLTRDADGELTSYSGENLVRLCFLFFRGNRGPRDGGHLASPRREDRTPAQGAICKRARLVPAGP